MAKTKKGKGDDEVEPGKVKLGPVIRLPGKHKGKIPAAVIRAAVRKVVLERKRREAEAAARAGESVEPGK